MQISSEILAEATAGREHFAKDLPGFQTAWDSTSLGSFKACPRKYLFEHVFSFRSRGTVAALSFGIVIHKGLEVFHHTLISGDREHALITAVRELLVEAQAWTGRDPDETTRTLRNAVRALVWYADHYAQVDALITHVLADGRPATELSFRLDAFKLDGYDILFCGHLDRVVEFLGGLFIEDYKTTTSALTEFFFSKYSPDNQTGLYQFAGSTILSRPVSGVIIEGIQLLVSGARFQRHIINRTPAQIGEVLESAQYFISQAKRCAETKSWPMNDKSCSMYTGCPFRGICSRDPAVRQSFLDTDFIRKPWNPLVSR